MDDFGELTVEKRSQGGSHGGKLQKNLWLLHVWCCQNHEEISRHEAILTASVKQLSEHKIMPRLQNHDTMLW